MLLHFASKIEIFLGIMLVLCKYIKKARALEILKYFGTTFFKVVSHLWIRSAPEARGTQIFLAHPETSSKKEHFNGATPLPAFHRLVGRKRSIKGNNVSPYYPYPPCNLNCGYYHCPPCGGKRRSDLHSFMYLLCNRWILFKYELLTSTYTIVFVRYHHFPKTWLTPTKLYRLLIWNRCFCRYSEIQAIFFEPVI